MTFGSLFAGIGGMDLGLERAGLECRWQCENSPAASRLLERSWPDTRRINDAVLATEEGLEWVYLICGGDPCPSRSKPRSIHGTAAPDMWPHFRGLVSLLRPVWVLRENVVSDDVGDVAADLARLGYLCVVLEMDGAEITGQSRPREYLCGVLESAGICPVRLFSEREGDRRDPPEGDEAGSVASCLTTHRRRFDHRDNYILEPGQGLRILDHPERERLQGFEPGWTAGLPARSRLVGNAAIPWKAEWIGRRIMESAS